MMLTIPRSRAAMMAAAMALALSPAIGSAQTTAHPKTTPGELRYKGARGGRRGSAVGDDGRGMTRVRPGLFVMENSVIYRKIVIEGKLHPAFEQARVNELLQTIASLD